MLGRSCAVSQTRGVNPMTIERALVIVILVVLAIFVITRLI